MGTLLFPTSAPTSDINTELLAHTPKRSPTLRQWTYAITESGRHWWPATSFRTFIMFLIVVNVACVIINTDPKFETGNPAFEAFYIQLEWFSVVAFSLEYSLCQGCRVSRPAALGDAAAGADRPDGDRALRRRPRHAAGRRLPRPLAHPAAARLLAAQDGTFVQGLR
jgi:hypothetical protein